MFTVNDEYIMKCENLIKSGKIPEVASILKYTSIRGLDRCWRLPLAQIGRRAGRTWLALKVLSPCFNLDFAKDTLSPSDEEKFEYSLLLIQVGAYEEAHRVLNSVQDEASPSRLKNLASLLMAERRYPEAVPCFEKYLSFEIQDFPSTLARMQLVTALIFQEDWGNCISHLEHIEEYASTSALEKLHARCIELRAQIAFFNKEYRQSLAYLSNADAILQKIGATDRFTTDKWTKLTDAYIRQDTTPIRQLRAQAMFEKRWEAVRECDYFTLGLQFDRSVFEQLYFGTPSATYRTRLIQKFGYRPLATRYLLRNFYSPTDELCERTIDLQTGSIAGTYESISRFEKSQYLGKELQLLNALVQDFYQPTQLGTLFEKLYPGQNLNPYSSPSRIRTLVNRIRPRFKKDNLAIEIRLENFQCTIKVTGKTGILTVGELGGGERYDVFLNRLKSKLTSRTYFTARHMELALEVSRSTCLRFIKWCLHNNSMTIQGQGKSTRYCLQRPNEAKSNHASQI